MTRLSNSSFLRYLLGIWVVVVAMGIRLALNPVMGSKQPFLVYYGAVLVVAWRFGLGPSILAVALSALAVVILHLSTRYELRVEQLDDAIGILLFLMVCAATLTLSEVNRRTHCRLRDQYDDCERAKQAEKAQREWLHATLASVGDGVIAGDAEGRIVLLNNLAQVLTGWSQKDAGGRPLDEVFRLVDEVSGSAVENPVRKLIRQAVPERIENRSILIARNGTKTPIELRASPIRDGAGEVAGVVLIFRDISESLRQSGIIEEQRRLAEFGRDIGLNLSESPDLKEMLQRCVELTVRHLDGAFSRIWTLDESGETLVLEASAGMYTHLDGDHSRVPVGQFKIGMIARDRAPHLSNHVSGDPLIPEQEWAEREGLIAFAGYPLVVDDRLIGVWAMFARHELSESALGAMQSVARAIAVGIQRKQASLALARSEAWLATTLRSIGDGVIATDGAGRVRFLNPVAEALTGWTQDEAGGQPMQTVFDIVNEQTRAKVANPVEKVIREGRIVGLANHTILIARNGQETPIEDSAAPILDDDGRIAGVVMVFRDATEEKLAQRLVLDSEARKAAILESAPDGIVTIDQNGMILEFNPAAERIFGRDRHKILGEQLRELIIPASMRNAHEQGMSHFRATGEGPILGKRIIVPAMRENGSEFPAELTVTRISTTGPPQFTAHIRDITDRLAAERAISESEWRYRTLIDVSPQIVWEANPDGELTYLNSWWRTYSGWPAEKALGDGWIEAVRPDHRARVLDIWAEALKLGETYEAEFPILRDSDRTYRWHLTRAMPVRDDSGTINKWVGVALDIHDRKQSEDERERLLKALREERRHLETLIDSIEDSIKELSLDGRIVAISKAGRRLLEIDRVEDLLGTPWLNLWKGDDRLAASEAITEAAAGRVGSFEGSRRTIHGNLRWWNVLVTPIVDSESRPRRLLAVSRDTTDKHLHAEERERLLAEAQEANRAKTHFLAMLSHELRTPLNPILLAVTSMLERPPSPEELKPNLEMICKYVNLQSRLIDDLLDVMRIVQGKMPLHWEVADAHQLIQQAIQICQSEVHGKGLSLQSDLSAQHVHINSDPARLHQVFWNLIKNAVKFTDAGGSITIRSENIDDRLSIEVSDTGIGIEPDLITRIFDPFQQGETSITRRFGGLGLGLAICKGIVEGHGGVLTVASGGKHQGTTFRVELRTMPDPRIETQHRSGGIEVESPEDRGTRPRNILLVEDEPATIRILARLLRSLGHSVVTASTIQDAIEEERQGNIDLVISDIGLPDGSGLDLMRRIVERRGTVQSIALTGYGMEEDILRSREAGFTAHMTKPIDFVKLEAMIQQLSSS